jgi:hypothetical protein
MMRSNLFLFFAFTIATPYYANARLLVRSKPPENHFGFLRPSTGENEMDTITTASIPSFIIGRNKQYSSPGSQVSTKVGDLMQSFREAVHKQQENTSHDVHVGKLLSAFQRLEDTMRNVGLKQNANDVAGNLAKVQELYQRAPSDRRDDMSALLRWEIESGVHKDEDGGFKIKEKSGAMGFLWLGRNLNYQYDMYRLMLEEGYEPIQAARVAFEQDLRPHLSWATSKVVQAGIKTLTPPRQSALFSKIGGFQEESYGAQEDDATRRDVKEMLNVWQPLLSEWKQVFDELELDNV